MNIFAVEHFRGFPDLMYYVNISLIIFWWIGRIVWHVYSVKWSEIKFCDFFADGLQPRKLQKFHDRENFQSYGVNRCTAYVGLAQARPN